MDYYLNRSDNFRPLGEWAFQLLARIKSNKDSLIMSGVILKELNVHFSREVVKQILDLFKEVILWVAYTEKQVKEAERISEQRNVPGADALHAILARDNNAVMVTRDAHFEELKDIIIVYKPEDLI